MECQDIIDKLKIATRQLNDYLLELDAKKEVVNDLRKKMNAFRVEKGIVCNGKTRKNKKGEKEEEDNLKSILHHCTF